MAFMICSKTGKIISVLNQLYTCNMYVTYAHTHTYIHTYIDVTHIQLLFKKAGKRPVKFIVIMQREKVWVYEGFFILFLPFRLSIFFLDCFSYHL